MTIGVKRVRFCVMNYWFRMSARKKAAELRPDFNIIQPSKNNRVNPVKIIVLAGLIVLGDPSQLY